MAYEDDVASALADIAANGELVSYQQIPDPLPADPAQPWKSNAVFQTLPDPIPVYVLFVKATARDTQGKVAELIVNTDTLAGSKGGLLGNNGFACRVNDLVTRANGDVYKIVDMETVDPGGLVILWKLNMSTGPVATPTNLQQFLEHNELEKIDDLLNNKIPGAL